MNSFAAVLVLISTLMHAGWNLLAKRERSQAYFFHGMLLFVAVAGFLPWVLGQWFAGALAPKIWICAVGAGICSGIYFLGLTLAYERADFTVVYPVARSLPVLMLGVVDVLRLRYPTLLGWAGMGLVAMGCFLAPLRGRRDLALSRYTNRAAVAMLLASFGTVGYSLIDKIAAEAVQKGPTSAAIYGYMLFLVTWATFAGTLKVIKPSAERVGPPSRPTLAMAAVMSFGAYWLVLWAYQLAQRISYVVAFRQFSIVIGVVLAIIVLKERPRILRVLATAFITTGLVLIALQG